MNMEKNVKMNSNNEAPSSLVTLKGREFSNVLGLLMREENTSCDVISHLDSEYVSEDSSYKSSDNESQLQNHQVVRKNENNLSYLYLFNSSSNYNSDKISKCMILRKTKSTNNICSLPDCAINQVTLQKRAKSFPHRALSNNFQENINKVQIEDRLAAKRYTLKRRLSIESTKLRAESFKSNSHCKTKDDNSDNDSFNIPTDVAANCEIKKRLKMYRRGISEIARRCSVVYNFLKKRSYSAHGPVTYNSSSSESVDEADIVLSRLKRRITRNRSREKRRSSRPKYVFSQNEPETTEYTSSEDNRDVDGRGHKAHLNTMGSNISQHSCKGLKGRRARSSGDLCNGESKSPTEVSVCGSVVGDMGWNRSLPNHLDGNRHLAEYSRISNSYAEFVPYNRYPRGKRSLWCRIPDTGPEGEQVWRLQGANFNPDDAPPREEYEAELQATFPFITPDNTFTVSVEKDGRGLGMSVHANGGLVHIRRLYPPGAAWRTGRLAPRDLLLAANGQPLAGLSTYEALEVLRTAAARVELRVCRPPADVVDSLTPPEPPTPPTRTPLPPADPLNCHPMHTRLSQTTSSGTTSSSDSRRKEPSPEIARQDLSLPGLEPSTQVFNVQYGEFDIVMNKVNGSLGFTLRKEDHSALGHYVRALVREPALSDGRIQPGDRIVAVNNMPMSGMSHASAVAYLRSCDSRVRLRLYRDGAATPVSPVSPTASPAAPQRVATDTDRRDKPPLRPEAVSMLCELAARRLDDPPRSPRLSPRKHRRLTRDNNNDVSQPACKENDLDSIRPPNNDIFINVPHMNDNILPFENNEPMSMPPTLFQDDDNFKHDNPTYQSVMLSTNVDTIFDEKNGLKKWDWNVLLPDEEVKEFPAPPPHVDMIQKENYDPDLSTCSDTNDPEIMTIELNRGWNSRLGFSIQCDAFSGCSYVSAVHAGSAAARDGRLRVGDVLLQVNDQKVASVKTPEVIELLRILRGSISITVLRTNRRPVANHTEG